MARYPAGTEPPGGVKEAPQHTSTSTPRRTSPPAAREHAAVTDHDWQDAIVAHQNAREARLSDQTLPRRSETLRRPESLQTDPHANS